ncbi:uncharacterized protein PAC_09358 [Phialocephala subalpina]|uniref:SAM domain-containing protein n=1 Tax=Phialocephala subalpina TaxID=576137 RepID=A0A1L7X392_9HELO|nr:uncharacterized protein PAC_09358 [Phialocephala subalpina]
MAQVEDILETVGMQRYSSAFLEAGFDNLESLSQIREIDFLKLNVRLGDRRKLQRAIARRQSWPDLAPLPIPKQNRNDHQVSSHEESVLLPSEPSSSSGSGSSSDLSLNPTLSSGSTSFPATPSPLSLLPSSIGLSHEKSHTVSDLQSYISAILRDKDILLDASSDYNDKVADLQSSNMQPYGMSISGLSLTSAAPLSTGESLVEEVCQALSRSATVPGPNILNHHQLQQNLEIIENSSQPFQIHLGYEVHLEAFAQKFNHIIHLFDESRLRENFDAAIKGSAIHEELMIELFLAFALGATYTEVQAPSLHLEMYLKGRVLLSTLQTWSDDMWMMRILVLVALYHLNMFPSSVFHFLELAIQLGQQNGLDSSTFPLPDVPEPRRSHWLRVWKSIDFLHNWQLLNSCKSKLSITDTEYMINIMEPPLLYEESLNSRLTQMNMSVLSSLLKEVLRDSARCHPAITSPPLLKVHLRSLSKFYSDLPICFCLQPSIQESGSRLVDGANDRQIASILNIHVFYLGIQCQLLYPALISLVHDSQIGGGSSAMIDYASQCVESAKAVVELCGDVSNSGFQLKGHWIVLHFLFNSICVMILDCVRAEKAGQMDVWTENLEHINKGLKLLQGIADGSPVVGYRMAAANTFLKSLQRY